MKDNNSLAHSTWNCKYHIVFLKIGSEIYDLISIY